MCSLWMKIFSHSVGCCAILMIVSFALQKLFSFVRFYLLIVVFSSFAGFCSGSCLLYQCVQGYSPVSLLLGSVYLVLGWGLWCLGLEFCTQWYIRIYLYAPTGWCPVNPALFVEGVSFIPLQISGFFIKNQVSMGVWIYVWVLIQFHWFTCLFLCHNPVVFITVTL